MNASQYVDQFGVALAEVRKRKLEISPEDEVSAALIIMQEMGKDRRMQEVGEERTAERAAPVRDLGAIKAKLGDMANDLDISQGADGMITLKAKTFIKDKQRWSAINRTIKESGGRWIGAGKESRWEI